MLILVLAVRKPPPRLRHSAFPWPALPRPPPPPRPDSAAAAAAPPPPLPPLPPHPDSAAAQGLTLAHFTAQLEDFRDTSLTSELNLSTFGSHSRVTLGHMEDKVSLSSAERGQSIKLSGNGNECKPQPPSPPGRHRRGLLRRRLRHRCRRHRRLVVAATTTNIQGLT